MKRCNKTILLFTVIAILIGSMIPVRAADSESPTIESAYGWYSADATEYHLTTVNDLFGFLEKILYGTSFLDKTVYLDADITINDADLSDLSRVDTSTLVRWIDVGSKNFAGTFNGNNHTISGIYYESSGSESGLFGKPTGTYAAVCNLAIVNSCMVSAGTDIGGVFSYVTGGSQGIVLSNLYVDMDIVANFTASVNCGGLLGRRRGSGSTTIMSCVYAGTITVDNSASADTRVGGLVGHTSRPLSVTDCAVYGAFQVLDGTVGGIVGNCTVSFSAERCVVAAVLSDTGDTVGAFYGACASAALTDNLYTAESIRPIPGGDIGSVTGQYTLVSLESLCGLDTMTLLTSQGFSNWKARLKSTPVPKTLLEMKGALPPRITDEEHTKLVGYQLSKAEQGKFSLRIVAVVDSLQYEAVGFQVSATNTVIGEKNREQACTTVYESLYGYTQDGVRVDYTAKELGGAYIYALNINNIPVNVGTIQFEARSYHIRNGQTVSDGSVVRFEINTDRIS